MEALETAFDGLSGVVDEVMKEIRAKFQEARQHAGIWESLQNFIAAVDWTVCMTSVMPFGVISYSFSPMPHFHAGRSRGS